MMLIQNHARDQKQLQHSLNCSNVLQTSRHRDNSKLILPEVIKSHLVCNIIQNLYQLQNLMKNF